MTDPRSRFALAAAAEERRRASLPASAPVLERMKRQLPRERIPDGPLAGRRPLARVSLEPEENWILGLLEAWARVAEVVGFYQARIADEGYLTTAVEELSVHELIRLLGYTARPGIAGSGWVAYSLGASRGMPDEVDIPRNAIVQSLPVKGRLPQTFELVAPLTARLEWNALNPALHSTTLQPPLLANATEVVLAGLRTLLRPGQVLLLQGEWPEKTSASAAAPAAKRSSYLRTIETSTPDATSRGAAAGTGALTRVTWKGKLDPTRHHTELESPEVFVLRRRARLFGYNATPWAELPPAVKRQQQPIQGGVLIGGPSTRGNWRGSNEGLPAVPIHALFASGSGVLWAGTQEGLYVRDGEDWRLADSRLLRGSVTSLAGDSLGRLWAGTADGRVLRSADGGASWEPLQATPSTPFLIRLARKLPAVAARLPSSVQLPRAPIVTVLEWSSNGTLCIGGGSGVFTNAGSGAGWHAANQGLPETDPKTGFAGVAVRALAAAGSLWAATEKGVFRASHPGARWKTASEGLPGFDAKTGICAVDVLSLVAYEDRRRRELVLVAGTKQGLYRRIGEGPWRPANIGLPSTDPLSRTATVEVSALAAAPDPATLAVWLWAGTDQGLYVSADLGATWSAVDTGQAPAAVSAVAASAASVAAATTFDGFPVNDWPGFHLTNGQIDLAGVEESLVPGSWLAVTQAEGAKSGAQTPPDLVLPVLEVSLVRRSSFGLSSLISRLSVPPEVDLSAYSLRDTIVLFDSQSLALATASVVVPEPLDPQSFLLSVLLEKPLPPQRPLGVSGKRIRVRLPTPIRGTVATQPSEFGGRVVTVLSGPKPLASSDAQRWVRLAVSTAWGQMNTVSAVEDALVWLNAETDDETVSELAWVAGCTMAPTADGSGAASQLELVSPLGNVYDPSTVVISANVGEVAQGESVVEALGSGDASRALQTFALTKVPLNYRSAPSVTGMRTTLEVRVDGVRWNEVASFHGAGPQDRVYVVRRDLSGRPIVTFGDGLRGSRLPSGQQNVTASYSSGLWTDPLERDQLALPRTRPLGVQAVSNPVPTSGATPAETQAELRLRAPRSTRPLSRIVSLSDFEDFALTFPGISRARLATLATRKGPVLSITVAGIAGQAVEPDGNLAISLRQAIAAARVPGPAVVLQSYAPVLFEVGARLRIDPAQTAAVVVERVRSMLSSTFDFAGARFGEILAASQVLTAIRGVSGVSDVELTTFCRSSEPASVRETLTARLAHLEVSGGESGEIVPAELLLIDDGAIALMVEAP